MKKKLIYAIVALFGFTIVACSPSTDSLIDQYEKACKKGDTEKVLKIAEKLDKAELTPEQKERLLKITLETNF